jgi:hypothetical protein
MKKNIRDEVAKSIKEGEEWAHNESKENSETYTFKAALDAGATILKMIPITSAIGAVVGYNAEYKTTDGNTHTTKFSEDEAKNFKRIVDDATGRVISGDRSIQDSLSNSRSHEVRNAYNETTSLSNAFSANGMTILGNNLLKLGYSEEDAVAEIMKIGELAATDPGLAFKRVQEINGGLKEVNGVEVEQVVHNQEALKTAHERGAADVLQQAETAQGRMGGSNASKMKERKEEIIRGRMEELRKQGYSDSEEQLRKQAEKWYNEGAAGKAFKGMQEVMAKRTKIKDEAVKKTGGQ